MNILVWVIVGALAGWLASMVMKTNASQGLMMDIVFGILGGILGGWVLQLLGVSAGVTGINIPSILTAFLGAVIVIWVLRKIRK